MFTIPRRDRIDKREAAETAIAKAVAEIELLAPDIRLTYAINALHNAREMVADVIDERLGLK